MEFYYLKGCNKIPPPPPLPLIRFLGNVACVAMSVKKSFQRIFFGLNIFLNTNWGSVLLKPNIKVVKVWNCIRPLSSQSIYQKIELNFGLSPQPWNLYQYHIMHLWGEFSFFQLLSKILTLLNPWYLHCNPETRVAILDCTPRDAI